MGEWWKCRSDERRRGPVLPVSRGPQSAPSFLISRKSRREKMRDARRSTRRAQAQCRCSSRHYRCQDGGRASFSGLAVPVEDQDPQLTPQDRAPTFRDLPRSACIVCRTVLDVLVPRCLWCPGVFQGHGDIKHINRWPKPSQKTKRAWDGELISTTCR